jgi:hypothetical protein
LKKVKLEDIHTSWLAVVLILIACVSVIILSLAGMGTGISITAKSGISAFAVAYLMAQVIERAVEPLSEKKVQGDSTAKLFGDTDQIKALRNLGDKRTTQQKEELEKWNAKRAIAIWGVTSFLGIFLCFFTVGLFDIVGVTFQPVAIAGRTITGHTFDSILSGMIVGGGTKSLHDLIGYLQAGKTG